MKRLIATALLIGLTACGGAEQESPTTTMVEITTTTEPTTTTTEKKTVAPPKRTTTTTVARPTTTTVPKPILTQEVAAVSLQDVTQRLLRAWMGGAGDDEYASFDEEIEGIVSEVLATHARIVTQEPWAKEFQHLVRGMDEFTYGEVKFFPEGTFTSLAVVGVPGAPVTLYAGVYVVGEEWTGSSGGRSDGDATIPGTYVVLDVEDCYWERLDDKGEIIDNNFIMAAPRVEVTIRSTDYAFNSTCGRWVRIGG